MTGNGGLSAIDANFFRNDKYQRENRLMEDHKNHNSCSEKLSFLTSTQGKPRRQKGIHTTQWTYQQAKKETQECIKKRKYNSDPSGQGFCEALQAPIWLVSSPPISGCQNLSQTLKWGIPPNGQTEKLFPPKLQDVQRKKKWEIGP